MRIIQIFLIFSLCGLSTAQGIGHAVFSIDNILCWVVDSSLGTSRPSGRIIKSCSRVTPEEAPPDIAKVMKRFPECRVYDVKVANQVTHSEESGFHIFRPHMHHLFSVLIDMGLVPHLFSSGTHERNNPLMTTALQDWLGVQYYDELIQQNHFTIFSKNNLREQREEERDSLIPFHGREKKDLTVISKQVSNSTKHNTILVEDDESYVVPEQIPFLKVRESCLLTTLCYLENGETLSEEDEFSLNQTYYIAGVLKASHDRMQYENISLRDALEKVLHIPDEGYGVHFRLYPSLNHEKDLGFIQEGLQLIRQKAPEAQLYSNQN